MENSQFKILLVDDETDVLEFLSYNLKKEGYHVLKAKNGREGLVLARDENPHLVILDVMMPEMDGIETCREIRLLPGFADTIIVFLTARGEDYSQIAGFDAGADDYITKPIKPKVLTSRVKALLRRHRSRKSPEPPVNLPDLTIDREKYVVIKDGKEISLPKKEFELLLLLTSRPNKVFSREEIFSSVWGNDVIVGDRTIDVHVRKIREKIGLENIKTIKGVGYKFEA
ncbi:DNA-binding response regulator, OmpR family, contains REC and winged-helix (wHTH) domain [Lentimicrobium saccharophilum]|uniref:Phosphate regulon transcriptional regulatory protein PhoB n=1 Tax=Lentimicrobium saccharophilum TaxID=1678841 RepID=A0A0S7C4Z3_9BACT|nr:response regulator transcription factor [Lentimicrobium saccharophilum]GAP43855.1 DNA-binding response regulator, OmpR family, contains REC and winged-helix (wHTH) domain [Lentimicrobium saccharophilum]